MLWEEFTVAPKESQSYFFRNYDFPFSFSFYWLKIRSFIITVSLEKQLPLSANGMSGHLIQEGEGISKIQNSGLSLSEETQ